VTDGAVVPMTGGPLVAPAVDVAAFVVAAFVVVVGSVTQVASSALGM